MIQTSQELFLSFFSLRFFDVLKSKLFFLRVKYLFLDCLFGYLDCLDHSRLLKMKRNNNNSLQIAQFLEDLRIIREQHMKMLTAIQHPEVLEIILEIQDPEDKGKIINGVDCLRWSRWFFSLLFRWYIKQFMDLKRSMKEKRKNNTISDNHNNKPMIRHQSGQVSNPMSC